MDRLGKADLKKTQIILEEYRVSNTELGFFGLVSDFFFITSAG